MPEDFDVKTMITDYMEKGFLENMIDMFRHDKSLYKLIGNLIAEIRQIVYESLADIGAKSGPE